MITYWLIKIFIGILGLIILPLMALPDVSLPTSILTSISTVSALLGLFYSFVPNLLTAIGTIVASYLGIELAIWAYKMIKWIYQKIPGIN